MTRPFRFRPRLARGFRPPVRLSLALEALEPRTLLATTSTSAAPLLIQLVDGNSTFPLPIVASADLALESTTIPGLLKATGSESTLTALRATLDRNNAVRWVEPLHSVSIQVDPNDPSYTDGTLSNLNGPWGIHAPTAWDKSIGSTKVIVAGIDTGMAYDHPDLYRNIWINQAEIPASRRANLTDVDGDDLITFFDLNDSRNQGAGKITDQNSDGVISASDILALMGKDGQGNDNGQGGWSDGVSQDGDTAHLDDLVGWNFITNTNRPLDDHGHGTHTAGTMGAVGNNARGVVGVSWVTQLMDLKFIGSDGNGDDLAGAQAIRYAADHGARVSNNSWGDPVFSQVIADAISYARTKGSIFVAAAGNAGANLDLPSNTFYPAVDPSDNVISVAATVKENGALAGFSNYGATTVDIAAPGTGIYSTVLGNGYGYSAGTSMAAPHVAGVVALVAATHPTWTYTQIIARVLSSVTPDPSLVGKVITGGIVNADAAIGNLSNAAALFVTTDTTTKGNWSNAYGADGYALAALPGAIVQPSYGTIAIAGQGNFFWANPTTDPRALLTGPTATTRVASCWYTGTSYTIDVNLTDNANHTLALYGLDWDGLGRAERVDVVDPTNGSVLDTRALTGFAGGTYLVWSVKGHVQLKVTLTGGINAVTSGVFLGGSAVQPPTGSATYVSTDTTTKGDWDKAYGGDGQGIAGLATEIAAPSYATVALTGQTTTTWANPSTDPRALKKPAPATDRLAARWDAASTFTIDVTITDNQTHRLGLYLLDFDNSGRAERIDLIDPGTGAVMDTRNVASFSGGTYLVWNVGGHVRIKVTATGTGSAVASGLFFGAALNPPPSTAAALFVTTDTTTKGNWSNAYGADGYALAALPGAIVQPSYGTIAIAGQGNFFWANPTTDPRALLTGPTATTRVASCWYTGTSYTIDVNLTDNANHTLALYGLDWDGLGRAERVDVVDPTNGSVLDTRALTGFAGGTYLVWSVKGHVQLKVTLTGGINAVTSGVFLGGSAVQPPTGSATYVSTDTTTKGDWDKAYGGDGQGIAGLATEIAAPSYATVALTGQTTTTWANPSTDPRALKKPAPATDRLAARWDAASTFTIDVTITDNQTHRLGLYLLDFDNSGRAERIDLIDPGTGAVMDTRNVASFSGGTYLVWNVGGHVRIKVTATGTGSAVASGLFFGAALNPPPSTAAALFVTTDTTTKGNWSNAYGADGYALAALPGAIVQPSYGTIAIAGQGNFFWANPTTDPRALLVSPGSSTRAATCWYTADSYTIDVNLADDVNHTLALYGLDWDNLGRGERIDIIDPSNGAVLDTRPLTAFGGGTYLVWSVKGHIQVKVTLTGGINAVTSGIFLGGPAV